MKKYSFWEVAFGSIFIIFSCATGTSYKNPSDPKGAPGWGAYEIKQTANTMVEEIYSLLSTKKDPVFIAFKPIRNKTSEHIETEILANEIKSSLTKKKIFFVELNLRGEILNEIAFGKTGMVDDSAIPIGKLKSPNYILEGVITDTSNFVNGRTIQYLVVTLNLIQTQSGVIEWTRNKEFLKSTRAANVEW